MKKFYCLFISILLGLSSVSFADELTLINGDVISGTILSLDANMVVIDTATLGRLSLERSKVQKGVFYGTQPALPPFDAPTDAVIMTDWKDTLSKNDCRNFVTFTSIKIVEKRLVGDRVEVRLEVKGDWVGRDSEFLGGPCRGFQFTRGKDQIVDKKMIYKKFGDRWILDLLQ